MLRFWLILGSWALLSFPAASDEPSLSIEELQRMVDERVQTLNPYQTLLNDPDPMRSSAAMEIMLESGDKTLEKMAIEFGLLSTDPSVRLAAVDHIMRQKPVLTLKVDGSTTESTWFDSIVTQNFRGSITDRREGIIRVPVGDFDDKKKCYVWATATNYCVFTVNADFVLFESNPANGNLAIGEDGGLRGTVKLSNVPEVIPATVQLLE